ncbi:MAG: epoxide hydrolase family protein [Dehalococcoidia bacterium]
MPAEPFTIAIPEAKLQDLRRRLEATNWAPDFANDDWRYGTDGRYLRELVDYWLTEYDWRRVEAEMNRSANFRTTVDGIPIHFIHERGKGPRPYPLILSHGWPWTFWDLSKVIGPLTDPAAHGLDPAISFDVVVPSLPGFAFSTPLTTPGVNFWVTADLWAKLMTDVLGYARFGAQGGDWGALVSAQLGHKYADRVSFVHLTNGINLGLFSHETPWSISGGAPPADLAPDVRERLIARQARVASHVAVQVLDPQTLAFALHDSPAGLAAWLIERRRAWGDCRGDIESRFSKDHLITTVALYWLNDAFVTSARYYAEAAKNPWRPSHGRTPVVEAPTGITFLEPDSGPGPRDWHREYFNLVYWDHHERGGHFATWEEPEAVVAGIRATYAAVLGR